MQREQRPIPYGPVSNDPDRVEVDMEEYEREAREKLEKALPDDQYIDVLWAEGSQNLAASLAGAVRGVVAAGPADWQGAIDRLREVHEQILAIAITGDHVREKATELFNDAWDEAEDSYD
jgi:hypothetical protein